MKPMTFSPTARRRSESGARRVSPSRRARLAALLAASGAFVSAPDPVFAQQREGADAAAAEENSGMATARMLPLNKPNLDVRIPQFKDGALESVIEAGEMTRVGDEDIAIKSMAIKLMDRGEEATRIDLEEASYNLTDKLVSSDRRAVVRQEGFTLSGDSLEFDTTAQRGKMVGRVHMRIHNAASFAPKKDDGSGTAAVAVVEESISVAQAARLIVYAADLALADNGQPSAQP